MKRTYTLIDGRKVYNSVELFLDKVEKTDSCWMWKAASTGAGYGQSSYRGKRTDAHRVSYLLFKGPIPLGHVVMHSCDVKKCVNPEHLSTGTTLDNMRDMHSKGRNRSRETYKKQAGEKCWNAKLTNKQAEEIRKEYESSNIGHRPLAKKYGVSRETIRGIVRGVRYVAS